MKISLKRTNEDYRFEASNSKGFTVTFDNTSQPDAQGVSPMETLLMAATACSGIDVISILKKQRQTVTAFAAEAEGERTEMDGAKPFTRLNIHYKLEGDIDPQKAHKAAALSFEKYCSVTKSLNPEVVVDFSVSVNGERAE